MARQPVKLPKPEIYLKKKFGIEGFKIYIFVYYNESTEYNRVEYFYNYFNYFMLWGQSDWARYYSEYKGETIDESKLKVISK